MLVEHSPALRSVHITCNFRCEQLGNIVRGHTNQEYEQMTDEEITDRLNELRENENHPGDTPGQRREWMIKFERTRHLMLWGDG